MESLRRAYLALCSVLSLYDETSGGGCVEVRNSRLVFGSLATRKSLPVWGVWSFARYSHDRAKFNNI